MKPWLPLLISVFSLLALPTFSQDQHWSLFEYAQMNTNPAQAGAFYGTYRLSGIIRDQEFFGNQTQGDGNIFGPSFTFGVDGPIIRGLRKQDWIGVGATFYSDDSGDGRLTTNLSHLAVAYHLALDKKQKTVLTFGVQGGMGTRRIKDWNALRFAQDDPAVGSGGMDIESSSEISFSNGNVELNSNKNRNELNQGNGALDINFGVLLKTKPNKTTNFEIGIVGKHLAPHRHGFNLEMRDPLDTAAAKIQNLPVLIGLHSGLDYQINKKWSVRPAFQFQTISGAKPYFQLGAMFGFKLDPKKDMILKFGPGYRVGDAAQIFLGLEKGPIKAAMSYDINLSELVQFTRWGGGVELAVSYVGVIFKQPDLKPVILCPRY